MEGDNLGNGPAGSRWNPTKEQINMLESLYMQGLRTPSAEQIQQITNRLRDFGHIEGKNVFYWFQNHKARQRQKQKQKKQDSIASFNRFLHKNPVFPPYFNVVCSPCYIQPPPQADLGLYQQYSKMPLDGGFKRRLLPENKHLACQKYNRMVHTRSNVNQELEFLSCTKDNTQETLDLFPIHPTGILQAKTGISTNDENSTPSTSSSSENDCIFGNRGGNCGHDFFDFFCGNDPYESH